MIRLILLRHATAEPVRSGQSDHERPLSDAGFDEAAGAGRQLRALGEKPSLVLCSTALRTRQTTQAALPAWGATPELRFFRRLFESPDYLGVVKGESGEAATVVVVGHNPFIQESALLLAGDSASDKAGPGQHFPPAAFAVLAADGSWSDVAPGSMRLERFVQPGD